MYPGFHSKAWKALAKPRRFERISSALLAALMLCSCSAGVGAFSFTAAGNHRRNAEQLKSEGKYEEAIVEYEKHIAERAAASSKFPGENPSFYYIMIGDLQLEQEKPQEALESYLKAQTDGVMSEFIIDRIRQVSSYYETRENYDAAIELLHKYRDLDPLVFDWDIDRLHKKTVRQEVQEDSFVIDVPEPPTETQ